MEFAWRHLHCPNCERGPTISGVSLAPRSAALRAWFPRQQHPHARGDQRRTDRSRAAIGYVGIILRDRRPVACGSRSLRSARLFCTAASPRNRNSHSAWRARDRHCPTRHVGCLGHGTRWIGNRPSHQPCLRPIHRVASLRGETDRHLRPHAAMPRSDGIIDFPGTGRNCRTNNRGMLRDLDRPL